MYPTEKSILYTFITGLSVLTLTLIIIIFSVIRHQRRRMREFTSQVLRDIKLIEDERERIAADLHDDLGSLIAAAKMNLATLAENFPLNTLLIRTQEILGNIQTRLKHVSHNLLPQTLIRDGLNNAVADLAAEWDLSNRKVVFTTTINDSTFHKDKALHVYRVIQELITNAIKHAKPDLVTIRFSVSKAKLIIYFTDDGLGFPETVRPGAKQFGLQNIQSRLQLLGAKYDMRSAPNKGTSYQISIPLENLEHE